MQEFTEKQLINNPAFADAVLGQIAMQERDRLFGEVSTLGIAASAPYKSDDILGKMVGKTIDLPVKELRNGKINHDRSATVYVDMKEQKDQSGQMRKYIDLIDIRTKQHVPITDATLKQIAALAAPHYNYEVIVNRFNNAENFGMTDTAKATEKMMALPELLKARAQMPSDPGLATHVQVANAIATGDISYVTGTIQREAQENQSEVAIAYSMRGQDNERVTGTLIFNKDGRIADIKDLPESQGLDIANARIVSVQEASKMLENGVMNIARNEIDKDQSKIEAESAQ